LTEKLGQLRNRLIDKLKERGKRKEEKKKENADVKQGVSVKVPVRTKKHIRTDAVNHLGLLQKEAFRENCEIF